MPELLIVAGVIGLLLALAMPAIQSAREASRATDCRSHLRQFMTACNAHESIHRKFPPTSTRWNDAAGKRHLAISTHRYLTASFDPPTFARIDWEDRASPAWFDGPTQHPTSSNQALLDRPIPGFLCPSDRLVDSATSYRCNLGVAAGIFAQPDDRVGLGAFVNGRALPTSAFTDGLSHTAFFSERTLGDGRPGILTRSRDLLDVRAQRGQDFPGVCRQASLTDVESEYSFAGYDWLLGGALNTWYYHIGTPNWTVSDCALGKGFTDGSYAVVSARSMHPGGVHLVFGDSAVDFVSDAVDALVWDELGTRTSITSLEWR